jgi:hypothetical protein
MPCRPAWRQCGRIGACVACDKLLGLNSGRAPRRAQNEPRFPSSGLSARLRRRGGGTQACNAIKRSGSTAACVHTTLATGWSGLTLAVHRAAGIGRGNEPGLHRSIGALAASRRRHPGMQRHQAQRQHGSMCACFAGNELLGLNSGRAPRRARNEPRRHRGFLSARSGVAEEAPGHQGLGFRVKGVRVLGFRV